MLFINSDGMHFFIMYYNLNNYNVCVRSIGHDGQEWWYGITIPTKLLKYIIIFSHKLHSTYIIYSCYYKLQDSTIAKSLVVKKFQNLFQIDIFSHKVLVC